MNLSDAAKKLEVSESYVLRLVLLERKLSEDLTEEEVQRYYDSDTMRAHRKIRELAKQELTDIQDKKIRESAKTDPLEKP